MNLYMCCVQLLKSTITAVLQAVFKPSSERDCNTDNESLAAVIPASLPDERDYCNDVHMATVRSASALFLHLVDRLKNSCSVETHAETLSLLQPASIIVFSACPVSCYDLLVTYLQRSVVAVTGVVTSNDSEFVEGHRFCSLLPDVITEPVRSVARHPNIAKLKEMTEFMQPVKG